GGQRAERRGLRPLYRFFGAESGQRTTPRAEGRRTPLPPTPRLLPGFLHLRPRALPPGRYALTGRDVDSRGCARPPGTQPRGSGPGAGLARLRSDRRLPGRGGGLSPRRAGDPGDGRDALGNRRRRRTGSGTEQYLDLEASGARRTLARRAPRLAVARRGHGREPAHGAQLHRAPLRVFHAADRVRLRHGRAWTERPKATEGVLH